MPVEKSAGAVIFRKENNKIFYLLLHYASVAQNSKARAEKDYWDFPKGHIEKGEKEIDTVKREVEEETGLKDIEFLEGFKSGIRYFFRFKGENILKFVTFYLAETKTPHQNKFGAGQAKDVKISEEHIGYEWLSYQDALAKLKFKNAKDVLQKANEFLEKNGIAK